MLFSLGNLKNYTRSVFSSIALLISLFICSCDGNNTADVPFSNKQGFINGSKIFDDIVTDENNNEVSLKTLKGNVVIVAFYTIWCPNCPPVLISLGKLADLLKKDGIKNVKILALNVGKEDINSLKTHYKSNNINGLDTYHSVPSEALNGIQGVPTCLVFDANGKYVFGYSGGDVDYFSNEFVDYIKKMSRIASISK